ncbi:hypothetical protein [Microvirga alba]|uniref:Uncharacterized protein n=1 Tax=Microvirga alba TaxID=2791025 RepID=A0A931FT14_9HYPH|nr:hypothetical protein [Microvirga alba]MBF9234261.1 hypothetical protein [Microvirga alba]
MAEIIAFEDIKKDAEQCEVLVLFKAKPASKTRPRGGGKKLEFPSSRPGISGNLSDLFEQASAVVTRHYDGDKRVPDAVAEKCLELLKALSKHAEPE